MKAALLDIIYFPLILLGAILFMEADALNRHPGRIMLQQEDSQSGDSSFLMEAEAGQRQYALLRNLDLEHKIQEETRSSDRLPGHASKGKAFRAVSSLAFMEVLGKNSFSLFSNQPPIYLIVCSFRL